MGHTQGEVIVGDLASLRTAGAGGQQFERLEAAALELCREQFSEAFIRRLATPSRQSNVVFAARSDDLEFAGFVLVLARARIFRAKGDL